jgi:hypothetical protein
MNGSLVATQTREEPSSPQNHARTKRTRHDAANGTATLSFAPASAPAAAGGAATPSQAMLINLRSQFETIVKALSDPASLVNGIYKRACERLRSMVAEAGLDMSVECDRMVYNYALQVRPHATCAACIACIGGGEEVSAAD